MGFPLNINHLAIGISTSPETSIWLCYGHPISFAMGTSLWLTIPNIDTTGGGLGALHRRDSRKIFCGKSPV